jgi:hypothetical protein
MIQNIDRFTQNAMTPDKNTAPWEKKIITCYNAYIHVLKNMRRVSSLPTERTSLFLFMYSKTSLGVSRHDTAKAYHDVFQCMTTSCITKHIAIHYHGI